MSEQQKHTPGPWSVERPMKGKYRGDFGIAPCHAQSGRVVGPIFAYLAKGRDDVQEANANLIAAAPDLLAALKVLLDEACSFSVSGVGFAEQCMGHKGPALAEAAIARAEGR